MHNQQSTMTSHVMRRARLRVDGYKVVRRWAVQYSFQLSPHPLPSSQSTSANTTQPMSSPLPSPLASPTPVASAVGKKSPARSKSSRVTKSSTTKKSTATKKSTTAKKSTVKKTASKSSPPDHPSWKDIIKVHLLDTIHKPLFTDCCHRRPLLSILKMPAPAFRAVRSRRHVRWLWRVFIRIDLRF